MSCDPGLLTQRSGALTEARWTPIDRSPRRPDSRVKMSRRRLVGVALSLLLFAPAPRVVSCVGPMTAEAANRCCAKCHHDTHGLGGGGCCLSRTVSPGVFPAIAKSPSVMWVVSRTPAVSVRVLDLTGLQVEGGVRAHAPPGASLHEQGCLLRI